VDTGRQALANAPRPAAAGREPSPSASAPPRGLRAGLPAPDEAPDELVAPVERTRVADAGAASRSDAVAVEEPLEIRVAGVSLAVLMRTPGHDRELALGWLASERVVESPDQVVSVRHCSHARDPEAADNAVQVRLAGGVTLDLERLRRGLFASASCGVCGKATIENALEHAPPLDDAARFPARAFFPLADHLRARQAAFAATGGLHAAGLFSPQGEPVVVREDVGRHNAVDKVLGHALRRGRWPLSGHVLLVSGRISYEIVQKALAARIPVVAAVSAPTSLAVALAGEARMALVGFLRVRTLNVYGHRERVLV